MLLDLQIAKTTESYTAAGTTIKNANLPPTIWMDVAINQRNRLLQKSVLRIISNFFCRIVTCCQRTAAMGCVGFQEGRNNTLGWVQNFWVSWAGFAFEKK